MNSLKSVKTFREKTQIGHQARFFTTVFLRVLSHSHFFFVPGFPAVTVCNQNLYRKSIIKNLGPVAEEFVKLTYPLTGKPATDFSNLNLTEELIHLNVTQLSIDNIQPPEEMFQDCKFRGSFLNCTESFSLIPTAFGWCYIFNSYETLLEHGPFVTYSTGSAQGLYLRLNVNQSEYYFGPSTSAGFKV